MRRRFSNFAHQRNYDQERKSEPIAYVYKFKGRFGRGLRWLAVRLEFGGDWRD